MDKDNMQALVNRFAAAWNDHDVDTLMACMSDDCVFYAVAGNTPLGATHRGQAAVRAAFAAVFANFPDAAWLDPEVYFDGDTAILITTFTVTNPDSVKTAARMVDLLTIVDGKITVKNAFRKVVS